MKKSLWSMTEGFSSPFPYNFETEGLRAESSLINRWRLNGVKYHEVNQATTKPPSVH